MRKVLVYELLKGIVASVLCIPFFSLLPFSLFVLLLPLDLIGWWFVMNRVSNSRWIVISIIIYIATFLFAFTWIITDHQGLEFLLDLDVIRRKL